jgi:hypothetical protein
MTKLFDPLSAAITPRHELWVSWGNGPLGKLSLFELPAGSLLVPGSQRIVTLDGRVLRGHPSQLIACKIGFQRGYVLLIRFWAIFCYDFVVAIYSLFSGTYPETMRVEAEVGATRYAETLGERGLIYQESLTKLEAQHQYVMSLNQDETPQKYDEELKKFQLHYQASEELYKIIVELDDNADESDENVDESLR